MTRAAAAGWHVRAAGLFVALAAVAGPPGIAGARTMQQKLAAACAVDIAHLCPGLTAASDDAKACLMRHRPEVGADCMRLVDASE